MSTNIHTKISTKKALLPNSIILRKPQHDNGRPSRSCESHNMMTTGRHDLVSATTRKRQAVMTLWEPQHDDDRPSRSCGIINKEIVVINPLKL